MSKTSSNAQLKSSRASAKASVSLRDTAVGFPVSRGNLSSVASSFSAAQLRSGGRPSYMSAFRLSKACCDYAACFCAPHLVQNDSLVGVPQGGLRTLKFRCKARGTFVCNTTGLGWVAVSPRTFWNYTAAAGWTSSTAGANTSISAESTFASDSFFSTADSHSGYLRLVSMCITVTYVGQLTVVEGSQFGVTVPAGTLDGATVAEMLTYGSVQRVPVMYGKTYCQLQQPLLVQTAAAAGVASPFEWWGTDSTLTVAQSVTSAIVVSAAHNDKFNYDVSAVYEWVPIYGFTSATGMAALNHLMTHSHADPVGMSAVQTAMQYMPLNGDAAEMPALGRKLISAAEDVLVEGLRGVGDTARNVAHFVSAKEAASLAARRYGARGAAVAGARGALLEDAALGVLLARKRSEALVSPTRGEPGESAKTDKGPAATNAATRAGAASALSDEEWALITAKRAAT